MELRSHNHLHFIWAIKGGSISKVLNVNSRGRPVLKLRKLEDIFEMETSKQKELIPKIQPRVVKDLDNSTGSCLLAGEVKIKDEPEEDYDVGEKVIVGDRDGISDNLGFGDTTLEQIRKQCKANKRKRQNHNKTVTLRNDSLVKEAHSVIQPKDGECDLEEPLSNWKSKFSKRRKGKKELKAKTCSTSSPTMQREDPLVSCDVKLEDCELSFTDCEAMTSIPADSLSGFEEKPSSSEIASPEAPETTNLVEEETFVSTGQAQFNVNGASVEFQDSASVVDEVPFEYQENIKPTTFSNSSVSEEKTTAADSLEGISAQNSDFPIAESGNDGCVNDPISPYTSSESEVTYDDGESIGSELEFCGNITGWEIVKIESPEILAVEYPVFPLLALCSSADHASLPASPRSQVHELDVDHIDHGLLCLDLNNTESSCKTEDVAKNYLNDIREATAIEQLAICYSPDSSYSDPAECMISAEEDHLPTKRQSESSEHTGSAESELAQSFNVSGGVTTVSDTYCIQNKKLHRPPEKLFSGRKFISPASQEKLRKALEHPDSPEKNSNKSKGKLYFSSQSASRILKAEGLDHIERVEVAANTKQTIQKPSSARQAQHQKAASKIPRNNIEAATPRFSTGCASLQVCSQNAIAFSQRQMRDVQSLATKLTNELNNMKRIVKGYMQTEGSPSKLSKCNVDETKNAIGKVERAEETAKKWLSMMERDCNRFCKLMGMIQDGSASENVAKKKRKITFADDGGGDLCHVKVFQNDIASSQSAMSKESVD